MNSKRVVVTGANGRLGTAIVDAFGDAGHSVVRLVRESDESKLPTYACDVTDESSVADCFATLASEQGPVDVLVHTVGMWNMSPLAETTLANWRLMLNVNLTSTFLCFREAIRNGSENMSLIGFASEQGADGGVGEQVAYSVAKAGVVRVVESVAAEYKDTGVTVNAIAPRVIKGAVESGKGVAPEDIAGMCLYLCSDAGAAISGTVIRMYGDSLG